MVIAHGLNALVQEDEKVEETLGDLYEEFHGEGKLMCYGEMVLNTTDVNTPAFIHRGNGSVHCKPYFSPTPAPEGFIIDGDDNSHWVSSSSTWTT